MMMMKHIFMVFTHHAKGNRNTAENIDSKGGPEPDSCGFGRVMVDWRDEMFSIIRVR
jgi:hypothetical protein